MKKKDKERVGKRVKMKHSQGKDTAVKCIFQKTDNFAEVFNKGLLKKDYVKASELQELDTTELAFIKDVPIQRHRDVLKRLRNGKTFAILGIENQSDIDYTMPLRVMGYNFLSYLKQQHQIENNKTKFSKNDRLAPVITLVVYYGETEWQKPRDLWDILDVPEDLKDFTPNFPINVIDVRHLSPEDIESFDGEVKAFFGFLAYDKNVKKLEDFISKNTLLFEDLSKNIAVAIEEYCGVDLSQEEYVTEKGGVNVCKAINDMKKKSIEQGIEQKQKQITINLLKLNLPKEQIVFATGLSLEQIAELEKNI